MQTRRSFFGKIIGVAVALLLPWNKSPKMLLTSADGGLWIEKFRIESPQYIINSDGLTVCQLSRGHVYFSRRVDPCEAIRVCDRLLPKLPDGFVRRQSCFEINDEGTSLYWRIEDREVFRVKV